MKMRYGIERAVVLSQRLDAMIDDVIDDCYFCSRVRSMVSSVGSPTMVPVSLNKVCN